MTYCALLLTDVVDSTRIAQELGDEAFAPLWARHDRSARDLLSSWGGREVDKTDGLLAMFNSLDDAAAYALAYHRAIEAAALPFKARVGLHWGSVSVRANNEADVALGAKAFEVEGLAKAMTARVMAVAQGGQTLLTGAAFEQLSSHNLRVLSHGHWRLKGLPEPVELFETGDDASPFVPPPDESKAYRVVRHGDLWRPRRDIQHSVPAERDSFIGRREPLLSIAQKFDSGARLVSILGMGGTGKTRLAIRFANAWLGDFPGGAWFCDLSQARTVDGIHFAVAQGLDVPLGKTDPVVQLAHAIAGRGKCLVILDNFEQVARFAEETLGRWLDRAPLAKFLVTTREVLGIVGEETFALAPLGTQDGVTLFHRRALAAKRDFLIDSSDGPAIEQLVDVLDGLPLAIELAAARVRVMSPNMLLLRMSERFKLLWSSAKRKDHHGTLRAAFDWSWELLTVAERATLAQLSTFEGGFSLSAAEATVDLAQFDGLASVDAVYSLVDKSFVRPVSDERFDLLQSVRAYAAEHLRTAGRYPGSGPLAQDACERRHGAFFASEPEQGIIWRHFDLDNLVAACRRATARGDGQTAAAALSRAWSPLRLRGPFRLGYELAALVRQKCELDEHGQASLAFVSGASLDLCGRPGEAIGEFDAAAKGARTLGLKQLEGTATNGLARLQAQSGNAIEAEASFYAALSIAREIRMPSLECGVLNNLGGFCETIGRLDDAGHHYLAALETAVAAGERRWESGSAGNLGQFYANHGRLAEARALYERAVAIAVELGDRQWEANGRCNLGLLHYAQSRLEPARTELSAALSAARDLGHRRLLAVVQCNLGLVAEASAQPSIALQCYEDAVTVARENADRRSEGQFLNCLGILHAREQRFASARNCLREAANLLESLGDRVNLALVQCSQVEAECLAGDAASARVALRAAESTTAALGQLDDDSELSRALRDARSRVESVAAAKL